MFASEDDRFQPISVRFDESSRTYFCFYRSNDEETIPLTFSFDLNEQKWSIDSGEFRGVSLNEIVDSNSSFEQQIQQIVKSFGQSSKPSPNRDSSFDLLARSNRTLSSANFKHSAHRLSANECPVILSAETLAKSKLTQNLRRTRTSASLSSVISTASNRDAAPPITEIWLEVKLTPTSVNVPSLNDDSTQILANVYQEQQLKRVAEKFVKLFGGTFQCDIGHTYQFDYDDHHWMFCVTKVECEPINRSS